MLKQLVKIFHVKQAVTCRDSVETSYVNCMYMYANVRGCVDFEWVCAICGAGPEKLPLDPTTCGKGDVSGCSGFATRDG
mgnify:CR=1 FL=1|tara:strand:+ start:1302 stop:1538 length:237 start_codon:yes stop_codon:yes gene_type:complete